MTADNARQAAHAELEAAIDAYLKVVQQDDDCHDVMAVDAVLLVGVQWIDDDGDRCGNVCILPRDGSQPTYITLGLLGLAKERIVARTVSQES